MGEVLLIFPAFLSIQRYYTNNYHPAVCQNSPGKKILSGSAIKIHSLLTGPSR